MIQSVSEVALWTRDLDAAVAFYRDRLGFEVDEIDPGHNAFLRPGGAQGAEGFLLVLFSPDDPGTELGREYLARTGGPQGDVYHVAFRVEPAQLDPFAEEIRNQGVALKGPVEFASGRRSYFLEDPDRHYIELTDR